jgi:hypothetical protein
MNGRARVETSLLTERKADFFWVLYERKPAHLGIKSEDKLDDVSFDFKRTKETVKEPKPD